MNQVSLSSAQWLAYRQAVVRHCLETFSREFGAQASSPSPEMQHLLSEAARVGVLHVQSRCLKDFISPDELLCWVSRALQKPQLLESLGAWFGGAWREAVSRIQDSDVPLASALDHKAFVAAFEWYLNDEERKQRWVHALVHNAEYQEMITGVLYEMIRQFFQDEALLSKLPGVGQFLKMGRWGVGKMLPQWELIIAESTKRFLNKNLSAALKLSERFLLESLNDARVRLIGEQVWTLLSQRTPGDLAGAAEVLSDPALKQWTMAHWQALVNGPYWEDVIMPTTRVTLEALCEITCGELWSVFELPESQLVAWNERLWRVLLADLAENEQVAALISEFLAPCFADDFLQSALLKVPATTELAPTD